MKYKSYTWNNIQQYIYQLSQKVEQSGEKFDLIVGIARGGLTISHILSDFLGLPVASFTITSYKDFKQQKELVLSYEVGALLDQKNILLVDDVSDSGKSLVRGVKHLQEMKAKKIKTASLFIKPWTKFKPDFYIKEATEWLIFPYEMKETINAFQKQFKKDGLSEKQIINKLKSIKLPTYWIKELRPD